MLLTVDVMTPLNVKWIKNKTRLMISLKNFIMKNVKNI